MGKIFPFIIKYWYYFFVANAILMVFGFRDLYSALVVASVVYGTYSMTRIKWNTTDVFVALALIYCLLSYFFSDYRIELFYYGIKNQLSVMFLYFVARSAKFRDDSFIENFKWPMLFIIVSGIALYFFPPGWYTAFRYSRLIESEGSLNFYEATRMSSFFAHPYFLGFGSCFMVIYVMKRILMDKQNSKWLYAAFLLSLVTLFFSQMRVAIAYTLLFMALVSAYAIFIDKRNASFFKIILVIIPLGIVLFYLIINSINDDFLYYITQRTTEKQGGLIEERILIFRGFFKYISILGYGLGRFGHEALSYHLVSIADAEYLRLLCELGVVGSFILLAPIVYCAYKGFRNLKKNFFETFVVFFFFFAMIGATPLEMTMQHNFLLWFCAGHIISKTSRG